MKVEAAVGSAAVDVRVPKDIMGHVINVGIEEASGRTILCWS